MNARIKKAITKYLEDNTQEALNLAREMNYQDGSFDWTDAYDFDELCDIAASDGKDAVAELVRACIFGGDNVYDGMVRYNAYGNLISGEEDDLLRDASDYLSDIVNGLDDYIDDYGEIDTIDVSDEFEEICKNANNGTVIVTNIKYDITSEDLEGSCYNTPEECIVGEKLPINLEFKVDLQELEDNEDDEAYIADLISDETGYCVLGFIYEITED